jgi:putative ABC transport system ATP-binding protein
MLQAENLTLEFKDGESTVKAVDGVSLTIKDRQFIGILGPSGSGKSSLLYLLCGLRRADGGDVRLDDRAYGGMTERERTALRRTEFGFVFQQHFLIDYLTVLENVLVAAPSQDKVQADIAKKLLDDLGLGGKRHRFIYELSGGERQRVAIGRAVIHRPRIIFADEPTGLLDHNTGRQVMDLLHAYCGQGSLVAVTHNPEILAEANLVIRMRDGKIVDREERAANRIKEAAL